MKSFALLPLLVVSAMAGEILQATLVEPVPQYSHEQNTATGEYGYSYSGGPSAKTEFRAPDGTTTGSYSYVDANGILQTVNYIADEFGFRVAGSNVPTDGVGSLDAPDVAVAKAAHLAEHSRQTLNGLNYRKKRSIFAAPILATTSYTQHLPVATSHQSRFQIHNSAKVIEQVHTPVIAATPLIASVHHSPLFFRKKRSIYGEAPLAIAAAPLPPTTAKIFDEIARKPVALVHGAAPVAIAAAPAAVEVRSAVPAVATTSYTQHVPVATSSQSRFQVHKGAKIIEQTSLPFYAPVAQLFPATFPETHFAPAFPAHHFTAPAFSPEAIVADSDTITVESA